MFFVIRFGVFGLLVMEVSCFGDLGFGWFLEITFYIKLEGVCIIKEGFYFEKVFFGLFRFENVSMKKERGGVILVGIRYCF